MGLNKCCESYILGAEPRKPHATASRFKEVQNCSSCSKKIQITFQRIELLGSPDQFEAVAAEYI